MLTLNTVFPYFFFPTIASLYADPIFSLLVSLILFFFFVLFFLIFLYLSLVLLGSQLLRNKKKLAAAIYPSFISPSADENNQYNGLDKRPFNENITSHRLKSIKHPKNSIYSNSVRRIETKKQYSSTYFMSLNKAKNNMLVSSKHNTVAQGSK